MKVDVVWRVQEEAIEEGDVEGSSQRRMEEERTKREEDRKVVLV